MAKQVRQRESYREEVCLIHRMTLGMMAWPPVSLRSTLRTATTTSAVEKDGEGGESQERLRQALLQKERARREVLFWLDANHREEKRTRALEARLRSLQPHAHPLSGGREGIVVEGDPIEGGETAASKGGVRAIRTMEDWADSVDERRAKGYSLHDEIKKRCGETRNEFNRPSTAFSPAQPILGSARGRRPLTAKRTKSPMITVQYDGFLTSRLMRSCFFTARS
ncbi:unnamed protein product [Phytomonas sp. EM1]|nr:unnamed protein product [Phytomonas sp. EM1]|eukprot:CCW64839.1 unnamed protein product [Phytomonas sp. isolate EM1]